MLCQFTVGNFRSFYTKRTFTMVAQSLSEGPANNVFFSGKKKYLKTAAVYGANSSGKSNFVRAFQAMGFTLLDSVRLNPTEPLRYYDPFILNENGPLEPSFFEVVFSSNEKTYRYGFEYNETTIVSEWLFQVLQTKEQVLFIRDGEGITVDEAHFVEGVDKEDQTEKNRLFLSLCAQLKGDISKSIIYWFENDIDVLSGLSAWRYEDYTKRLLHNNDVKSIDMRELYRKLKLGFQDVATREEKVVSHRGNMEYSRTQLEVDSIHSVYDNDGTEGIYCPAAESSNKKKNAATRAASDVVSGVGSVAGTILTGNPFVGRMASSGFSAATSAINDAGMIEVTVSSGYEFYVFENKKEENKNGKR